MTKNFYMGKPCKRGHGGKRYVINRNCVECQRALNADPVRKARLSAYIRSPECKAKARVRNYGVTSDMFNFTFAGQNFCCGNCGGAEPGSKYDWHADHCHETGRFRGVLCSTCNTGLGKLGDNVEGLLKAVEYIVGEALPTNLTKQILRMDGRPNLSPPTEPNARPRPSLRLVSSSQNFVGQSRKSA